jgi:hypothetical protein
MVLGMLDHTELTWVSHCSPALRRRLTMAGPRFWEGVCPPNLLYAFNVARFVVAKRILSAYGLPRIVGSGEVLAMTDACWAGLELAREVDRMQWLVTVYRPQFNLRRVYSSGTLNDYLYDVCRRGHLEAAQWYVRYFELTWRDIRGWDADRLQHGYFTQRWVPDRLATLCDQDSLAIVQWFVGHFELTGKDAKWILTRRVSDRSTSIWLAAQFDQ